MDIQEVKKIANLAKLNLTDDENTKFAPQLSEILTYVKKLEEVNTENVTPTLHATSDLKNRFQVLEKDSEKVKTADLLKNAKFSKDNYVQTEAVFK